MIVSLDYMEGEIINSVPATCAGFKEKDFLFV